MFCRARTKLDVEYCKTDWAAVEELEPEAAVLCNRSDVKRCPLHLDLLLVPHGQHCLHGQHRIDLHFLPSRPALHR